MKSRMMRFRVYLICAMNQLLVGAIDLEVTSLTEKHAIALKSNLVNPVGYDDVERRLGPENVPVLQLGNTIAGAAAGDQLGFTVSLSEDGTRMATGSGYSDEGGVESGKAQVFEWNGSDWTQMGNNFQAEGAGDLLGSYISLSANGERVAMGAVRNDGNGVNSGHARIFDWNGSNWAQIGSDIDGLSSGDGFGRSLRLSGDGSTVAIGSPYANNEAGYVRVFELVGFEWEQKGATITGLAEGDRARFCALSGNGDVLAVGAGQDNGERGYVRVFMWDGVRAWSQVGSLITGLSDGDYLGYGLDISSDGLVLAVGAPGGDTSNGYAQIYALSSTQWELKTTIQGEDEGGRFGNRVSLSSNGMRLSVGAWKAEETGVVQVFESSDNLSSFYKLGSPISGDNPGDELRSSSLSGDGLTLAVGARYGDPNGATNSGYAKVFQLEFTTAPSSAPTVSNAPSLSISVNSDSGQTPDNDKAQRNENRGTEGADGAMDESVVGSTGVDGDLYRAAAGGLAFNITTVRMESEFNENNNQNEIQMVYDYYAPADTTNTSYDLRLYSKDCVTHGENSNVESKYISVAQADPLYIRNNADQDTINAKGHDDQVHLAGQGWGQQIRLDIPLDIHQDEIFNSPYFEYEPGSHYTIAHIEFCARFVMFYDIDNDGNFNIYKDDPYLEIEAVQFHETLIKLAFNLTQDFQVSDISLQKDAIIERSDTQRLKYELKVYHCEPNVGNIDLGNSASVELPYSPGNYYDANYAIGNDTYIETTTRVITQSTIVYICLTLVGNSANIGIRELAQLEFIQPASQITSFAIYKRTPNAITTESHYGEMKRKRMVVSTRLVLPFFDNRNPTYNNPADADAEAANKLNEDYSSASSSNVIAKGTAIMMFQNDFNNVRHLLGFNRDLQEAGEEAEEPFEVNLGLGYDEESSGNHLMVAMTLSVLGVLSFAAIM